MTSRRGFFAALAGLSAGAALDPERLLWRPGRKLISIPRPRPEFQFDERSLMAVEDLERQGYRFNEIHVGDKLLRIPVPEFMLCNPEMIEKLNLDGQRHLCFHRYALAMESPRIDPAELAAAIQDLKGEQW